jgi:asparagine N-glycosylation enzyme membrane subunit Stt3
MQWPKPFPFNLEAYAAGVFVGTLVFGICFMLLGMGIMGIVICVLGFPVSFVVFAPASQVAIRLAYRWGWKTRRQFQIVGMMAAVGTTLPIALLGAFGSASSTDLLASLAMCLGLTIVSALAGAAGGWMYWSTDRQPR